MNKIKNDYIIKEQLGVGSYGKVYKVIKRDSNNLLSSNNPNNNHKPKYLVLKKISLFNLKDNEIKDVKNEAKILSSISNKHIVKYHESWIESNNFKYSNGIL